MDYLYEPQLARLPNGLRVITVKRPYGRTFGATLAIGTGTRSDPSKLPGLAHFCEHLGFRGPNQKFAEELGELGAYVNAQTMPEWTSFDVTGHIDQLELGLELFANVLRNPELSDEEIAAEREIFRHELDEDGASSRREATYIRFVKSILGDPNWWTNRRKQVKAIKQFDCETVTAFRRTHLVPTNACLAIVGPLSHDRMLENIERRIGPVIGQENAARGGIAKMPPPERRVTVCRDSNPYVWIAIAHVIDRVDPVIRLTNSIVAHHLGDGQQSELFRRLRKERSLAYDVQMKSWSSLRHSTMHFYCCVHRRSVREALDIILKHHDRVAAEGIDESLLEAAKQRMTRHHELGMDFPAQLAAYLACEALHPDADERMLADAYLKQVSSLTVCDVSEAAATLLSARSRYAFVGGGLDVLTWYRVKRMLSANLSSG